MARLSATGGEGGGPSWADALYGAAAGHGSDSGDVSRRAPMNSVARVPAVSGSRFAHLEASVSELQVEMSARRLTAHALTATYMGRIRSLDQRGPTVRSVVEVTPDAHLVKRLREAGAVILGKTNLSEWANIRSTRSTSGWSARGGLTRNPYALDRNTSGSSSGSAGG